MCKPYEHKFTVCVQHGSDWKPHLFEEKAIYMLRDNQIFDIDVLLCVLCT